MYLRALAVYRENGSGYVSSEELANDLCLNSPQIRKDLSYFGTFGKRGMGYEVDELRELLLEGIVIILSGQLCKILGAHQGH